VASYRPRSIQFGRTLAPIVPHLVHTMRGPNDGTVRSPGGWSTSTITRWRWTSRERTPFSRMFAKAVKVKSMANGFNSHGSTRFGRVSGNQPLLAHKLGLRLPTVSTSLLS
jgi:hypothetical protein